MLRSGAPTIRKAPDSGFAFIRACWPQAKPLKRRDLKGGLAEGVTHAETNKSRPHGRLGGAGQTTRPTRLKATVVWFAILVLAILNGALREKVLIPAFGRFAGLIASGAILSICIFLVELATAPWCGPMPSRAWLMVGAFWLLLTLAFEFSFGFLAQHKTLTELLAAYTFRGGNLWPVVLVFTFISPWLAAKVLGLC